MKKLAFLLSCIMLMTILIPAIGTSAAPADSTPISDVAGFLAIADNPTGKYHLTNDIDFLAADYGDVGYILLEFDGTLDGCGYSIYNFLISANHSECSGLIRNLGQKEGATVKNLNIGKPNDPVIIKTDAKSDGDSHGILAAVCGAKGKYLTIDIDNVHMYAECEYAGEGIKSNFGCISGYSFASTFLNISNCTFTGNVTMGDPSTVTTKDLNCAGFIGANFTTVTFTNCTNYANITTYPCSKSMSQRAAGFVGYEGGTGCSLTNCFNFGNMTAVDHAEGSPAVGGFIGTANTVDGYETVLKNCINIGDLVGSQLCGGLIGNVRRADLIITYCANYGNYTKSDTGNADVGFIENSVLSTITGFSDKTGQIYVAPGETQPVETTEAPIETTEAPVVTTEAPVVTTEAPVVTTEAPADTTAPSTSGPTGDSMWIFAAVAILSICCVGLIAKKKEN